MKSATIMGLILVSLGVMVMVVQGISYTSKDKVVDIGGFHVITETRKDIDVPLIVGGSALAVGIIFIVAGLRKPGSREIA